MLERKPGAVQVGWDTAEPVPVPATGDAGVTGRVAVDGARMVGPRDPAPVTSSSASGKCCPVAVVVSLAPFVSAAFFVVEPLDWLLLWLLMTPVASVGGVAVCGAG